MKLLFICPGLLKNSIKFFIISKSFSNHSKKTLQFCVSTILYVWFYSKHDIEISQLSSVVVLLIEHSLLGQNSYSQTIFQNFTHY